MRGPCRSQSEIRRIRVPPPLLGRNILIYSGFFISSACLWTKWYLRSPFRLNVRPQPFKGHTIFLESKGKRLKTLVLTLREGTLCSLGSLGSLERTLSSECECTSLLSSHPLRTLSFYFRLHPSQKTHCSLHSKGGTRPGRRGRVCWRGQP